MLYKLNTRLALKESYKIIEIESVLISLFNLIDLFILSFLLLYIFYLFIFSLSLFLSIFINKDLIKKTFKKRERNIIKIL